MFRRVNADLDTFDFTNRLWYLQYSWTKDQEEEFRRWLADYLLKNKIVSKGYKRGTTVAYHEAGKLVAFYGWKNKES